MAVVQATGSSPAGDIVIIEIPSAAYGSIDATKPSGSSVGSPRAIIVFSIAS